MPASLDQIDWCDTPLLPAVRDLAWEEESAKRLGRATSMAPYLTPVRWMLAADEMMESRVTPSLTPELEKLISLVVAMDNSCRYCYGAFRSILKIMGYSERLIRKLEESLAVDELSPAERAALEFAQKVSRYAPRPSTEDVQGLFDIGFSRIQIAEIAYAVGNSAAGNRLATMLALPPDPVEAEEPKLLRKWLNAFTRKQFRDSLAKTLKVESQRDYSGPGSRIVRALEGSPAGAALSRILSSAWESPITSPRVKALVFAVVARGMVCPACELEATELLKAEGWTEEETTHLLTHLSSDRLDAFELKVLRFARETVRYQTRRMQNLAREFATGMEREVVIEVIGLVSYANALGRMSVLLQEC